MVKKLQTSNELDENKGSRCLFETEIDEVLHNAKRWYWNKTKVYMCHNPPSYESIAKSKNFVSEQTVRNKLNAYFISFVFNDAHEGGVRDYGLHVGQMSVAGTHQLNARTNQQRLVKYLIAGFTWTKKIMYTERWLSPRDDLDGRGGGGGGGYSGSGGPS